MKSIAFFLLAVCAYSVYAERCDKVSSCKETMCSSTASHAHVRCIGHHCTCSTDVLPCLLQNDCLNGTCITNHAQKAAFQCLNGECHCFKIDVAVGHN